MSARAHTHTHTYALIKYAYISSAPHSPALFPPLCVHNILCVSVRPILAHWARATSIASERGDRKRRVGMICIISEFYIWRNNWQSEQLHKFKSAMSVHSSPLAKKCLCYVFVLSTLCVCVRAFLLCFVCVCHFARLLCGQKKFYGNSLIKVAALFSFIRALSRNPISLFYLGIVESEQMPTKILGKRISHQMHRKEVGRQCAAQLAKKIRRSVRVQQVARLLTPFVWEHRKYDFRRLPRYIATCQSTHKIVQRHWNSYCTYLEQSVIVVAIVTHTRI